MGAEQSSSRPASDPVPRKTCYYEVLGVDVQASEEEIRRAYKKKALELHPDRNLNDTATATRKFAEVQTAYEILSDGQERAWYDSHRDAILRGHTDSSDDSHSQATTHYNVRLTTSEHIISLISRFNSSVPFTDSPSGFFGILNSTFDQLAMEEAAASEWDGLEAVDFPPFGAAADDYESVARSFYNAWSSFSTRKSFSWKDKYRQADAPDRRIRRLMDKENKKLRDDAIRDFNDAVRSLVAFVKKRDPRYVPNTQSEAERQKILRDSAAAQAARSRAAYQGKLAEFVVPDWAQSRDPGDHGNEFSATEEDSEVEHIECVVCSKIFKSEKQFEAHEKSKKHVRAVQNIRRQMKKEDADLDLESSSSPVIQPEQPEATAELTNVFYCSGREPDQSAALLSHPGQSADGAVDGDEEDEEDVGGEGSEGDNDGDYAPRDAVADRILDGKQPGLGQIGADSDVKAKEEVPEMPDPALDGAQPKKIGKAKARREKKAARQATSAGPDSMHQCAVCNEAFTSRTKLFSHLRQSHTDRASVPRAAKGGGKKQRV